MNFKVKFICLVVIFLSSVVFGESDYIGAGTEFIFKSNSSNGLHFSPCEDDKESSCSILTKSVNPEWSPQKQRKICTLEIKGKKVSTLKIEDKTRKLTVTEVHRDGRNAVKSLTLNGAKYPIILSCVSESEYLNHKNTIPNFELTEKFLSGFTEFILGKINHDNANLIWPRFDGVENL